MCGIFGVWKHPDITGSDLKRASALLRHRGPDDEGYLAVYEGVASPFSGNDTAAPGLPPLPDTHPCPNALLHRRLSILDLSPAGHQPMQLSGRKIYITYNGEVYNYQSLAEEHGLQPQSGTDTEVILGLYAKLGTAAFPLMRGMWAMAILDLEQGELLLCRDRFGIKPLYYSMQGAALAFSSEIKPLLEVVDARRSLLRSKLLQFLTYGATDDPCETFFDHIQALPPGHLLRYRLSDGQCAMEKWYSLQAAEGASPEAFEALFAQSIREHCIADVEVGSCLSGGLDSSAIVAEAAAEATHFKTFTASFPGEHFDEAHFARQLTALHPGLEQYFTTPSAEDFMQAFDGLVRLQERPIGSASIFAQYAVMQCASEAGIKVLLDGQGADEVFGGYYPFAGAYLLGLLRQGRFAAFAKAKKALEHQFNPAMNTAMARAAFYHLPRPLQQHLRKRERLGSRLIAPDLRSEAAALSAPDRGSARFDTLTHKSIRHGLYELLHYEDRNAMHFGIESRVPFLDHRLVEWALGLAANEKIVDGWTKYPIRRHLHARGLESLAWRKDKLGFVAPQQRWREALLPQLRSMALDGPTPSWLDRAELESLFHIDLRRNAHLSEFWRVTALLRWVELMGVEMG